MSTFVYMTSCDGCGHCVDICPSDIMHIDPTTRRAYNIEPNFCWECYSCVKACPQNAIDAEDMLILLRWVTVFVFFERKKKELYHGRLNLGMEEKRILYHLLGQLHGVQ